MMNTKYIFVLLGTLLLAASGYAQCNNCQYTITVPNNLTHNLTGGQVVCIVGNGSFTGRLNNFSGNTLCIGTGVTYNPASAPNYNGNWTIINNGTFQNTNNLNFNSGTSFTNGATGTITLGSLNLNAYFANYGTMTVSSLTVNSNANVTLGGTTTITGSLMNNGNITVVGSVTANGITNNGSGRIVGGPNTGCNFIQSTGSWTNNGQYGGTGTDLLVGNTGGPIVSPATSSVPTTPAAQASNLQLSASGSTINGSFNSTTASGYLVLRATGSSVPTITNPANYGNYTAGQTLGAWTVLAINTGQGSTTFTDAAPAGCANVYYRVYAFNAVGNCRNFNTNNVLASSLTGTPNLASTTPASRCGTGSVTLSANYSVGAVSWYDASSGGNLVGTGNNLTINSLANTTTYYASATFGSCTTARTAVTATVTAAPAGTASGSQELCAATTPSSLTLSGVSGNVLRWESADDANFTINLTTIANTTSSLASAQMGTINGTRYFRAVLENGSCQVASNAVYVKYPTTTWNGSTWSDGLPDANKRVVFAGNYNSSGDVYACSVVVNSGASVQFNAQHNLVVSCAVDVSAATVPGLLTFENTASLVQLLNGYANGGKITYKRNTAPVRRYDYTYWASPVVGQNLLALSPGTLSDKFYAYSPTAGNWQGLNASGTTMATGTGYIVRAPQSFDLTQTAVYGAQFKGTPANGLITTPVLVGADAWNLIGNPYPSELDLNAFFAYNASVLEGTAYLWTHNTLPSNQIPGGWAYNYTSDDYAVYNATGSVSTGGATSDGNNNAPSGRVSSGQSFFVKATQAGTVRFRNNMRRVGSNSGFFRPAAPQNTQDSQRFWLNLRNDEGAFKQILVGYLPEATAGFDAGFDADALNGNSYLGFYSMADNRTLTIQAKPYPQQESDVVPLGFTATAAGSYFIELDRGDAYFTSQPIYLKDQELNLLHDLHAGRYDFQTAAGTQNGRFSIVYANNLLKTTKQDAAPLELLVWTNDKNVHVACPASGIRQVVLLDLKGRTLAVTSAPSAKEIKVDASGLATQPLLVRVQLQDGAWQTRKIVLY